MTNIAISLIIALALALAFAVVIYFLRISVIRSHSQMKRFLDRRFNVIRRANSGHAAHCDYIDRAMIKRWGLWGIAMIPLPVMGFKLISDDPDVLSALIFAAPLIFSGMLFADSRAAIRFIQCLGVEQYQIKPNKTLHPTAGNVPL